MSRLSRRPRRERGASTVIVAFLVPVLFAAAALGIDISRLAYERQDLSNALDAAAQAGASSLPGDAAGPRDAAVAFARANDAAADPTVTFWCVVKSTGATRAVRTDQIPAVCDPGTVVGARCNESICAIPCVPGAGRTCNTVTVQDDKDVPYSFARVIGFDNGNTGSLTSSACKGSCGAELPNPMDVVIVADRTSSMSTTDRNLMVAAIKNTLATMTKDLQYVALGTIHRSSATPGSCITTPSSSATSGPWIPVPFSNDYTLLSPGPGVSAPVNSASTLIRGLDCLGSSSQGTYLAAPLKAAARYVLGSSPNNLASLPARPLAARKAIIFETDGQPNESAIAGSTSLATSSDIGSADGAQACTNFRQVAINTKAQGVLVVTVAFGDARSARCATGGQYVRDVLAAAASPDAQGAASDADNDCSTAALRATENTDGDFFFCAANGSEMGGIFVSAVNQLSPHTRLLRLP